MTKGLTAALISSVVLASAPARAADTPEKAFTQAAALYSGAHPDPTAALSAFQSMVHNFKDSSLSAEAYFTMGEISRELGLKLLEADADFSRDPDLLPLPSSANSRFAEAEDAYRRALTIPTDDALRQTILYRLGELAYVRRDWRSAENRFATVPTEGKPTYVTPFGLIGSAAAYAAETKISESHRDLEELAKAYPVHVAGPEAVLVRAIVAMHIGRSAEAEELLKNLPSAQAQYALGTNYLIWGKPLLAASVFNKLNTSNPPPNLREPSRFFLGDAFFLSKDYDGAINSYTAFLKDFPKSRFKAAALYRIGGAYFKKGAYDEARQSFDSLIKRFGDDFYADMARDFIGECFLAVGRLREARDAFGSIASGRTSSHQEMALFKCIWIDKQLGESADAVKTAKKFIAGYPQSPLLPKVWLMLANIQLEMKDTASAVKSYEAVIDAAPSRAVAAQALYLLLKLNYDQKKYNFILTTGQYLLDQLSKSPSKWRSFSSLIVADTYLRLNRTKEARAIYERLLQGDYADGVAPIYAQDGIAWCDELMGQGRQAIADRQKLRTMLAVAPSSTTANNFNDLGLADSFYSQKDYADAYDLYAQFAKEHPESPAVATALYRAGESLYRQKFYSQAIGAWQNLLTSKPGTPEAIKASYQIGDTLFRSARYEEAEGVYDKILAANPKDAQAPFVVLRLAQIAYYRKDDDKAFARVRELATRFPEAVEVNAGLDLAEAASERSPKSDLGGLINAVVAANPKSPAAAQAQFRLAQSRFDAKKYPEAATLFQRFSVEHVGDAMLAKAQLLLGESYFFAKDYARCIPVYERYVESYASTKEAPLALFHLGSAYYSLKQYDKMIAPFKKIIRSYPTSEYVDLARFNIALAYQQSGALDDAIASYNAYIKVATSTDQMVGALWNLFDIQQKKGSAAGGIAVLRRIVEVTKGTGAVACEASYKIGELQKATGDEAGAVRSWAATTKIRPLSSPYRLQALIQLSKVYEKNQDFSKAYDVYSDLAKNGDSDPELMKAARARAREIGAALPRGKR